MRPFTAIAKRSGPVCLDRIFWSVTAPVSSCSVTNLIAPRLNSLVKYDEGYVS